MEIYLTMTCLTMCLWHRKATPKHLNQSMSCSPHYYKRWRGRWVVQRRRERLKLNKVIIESDKLAFFVIESSYYQSYYCKLALYRNSSSNSGDCPLQNLHTYQNNSVNIYTCPTRGDTWSNLTFQYYYYQAFFYNIKYPPKLVNVREFQMTKLFTSLADMQL